MTGQVLQVNGGLHAAPQPDATRDQRLDEGGRQAVIWLRAESGYSRPARVVR